MNNMWHIVYIYQHVIQELREKAQELLAKEERKRQNKSKEDSSSSNEGDNNASTQGS